MPHSRKVRVFFVAAGLASLISIVGIASIPALRWRAKIVFDKATGQLHDVEWSDLQWLLRRGSPLNLKVMVETKNPFMAIESKLSSPSDLKAGEQLFSQNCAACHGDQALGGPGGPSLHNRTFRRGGSDWAIFQTITLGIPNTAMSGRQLPRDDVWKLVSYLKRTIVAPPKDATLHESTLAESSLIPVAQAELKVAEDNPDEWLTYSGSYASHRHSRLDKINRQNVSQLRVEWVRQLATSAERVETTPIVRGSMMFVTEPPSRVLALDATSGRILWEYSRDLPSRLPLCCGPVNRGVAVLGNRVYFGTLDAHLIALDASTGELVWDVAVADSSQGYSITGAPLTLEDMVVTGVGGGEFGIRGFVDAYDAASGQRRWRFYTVPAVGEPGSDTWENISKRAGGGPTWLSGSYDPELHLIYWGVGNPSPNFDGNSRKGDNLYSNSVVALDANSGKLRWYFQFTPHDMHDWDSVQIPVLVDAVVDGSKRKLLVFANRNAFYYVLDRINGQFLFGAPFVRQTWADGLDAKGRPIVRPESAPSRAGSVVYPSLTGGTNWWSPTYDAEAKLIYVPTVDQGGVFYEWPNRPRGDEGFILGGFDTKVPHEDLVVAVKALDVMTGRVRWQYSRRPRRAHGEIVGGLMSTAGGLVFGGDLEEFFALDASTGAELWHFQTGGQIAAAPVTYEVAGHQYVAIAAGHNILTFTLPRLDSRKKTRD
jgi:alcohol dehydrogenase (cytochrome c)